MSIDYTGSHDDRHAAWRNGEEGAHVRASRVRRGALGSPRRTGGGSGRSPV